MKNRIRELRAEKISHNFASVWAGSISGNRQCVRKRKASAKSEISDQNGRYFPYRFDYLIGRSDVRKPSATSPLPNEDIALLDCFHDLDTVDKARLVAYQGLSDKSLKD